MDQANQPVPTPPAAKPEAAPGGLTLPDWLTVSSSPHLHTKESVEKIMWTVFLTLLPAAVWAVYRFGLRALLLMVVCLAAAIGTEWVVLKARKAPMTALDGSAALTGLLLAFCCPPGLPLWMGALGSVFAVFVAKHTFGGLGQNIFNPAHIGRAFLLASFPVQMTTWSEVASSCANADQLSGAWELANSCTAGVTQATPLGIVKEMGYPVLTAQLGEGTELWTKLLLGQVNGSLGEVSALLLLLGGLVLIFKGYIRWEAPLIYIATVGALTWVLPGGKGSTGFFTGDPLFAILSGGVVLGAFYMITDYVTTPITRKGQIIFALGAGALCWLIRKFGGYPEGVCYSILLMNCFTPLIDRLVKPKRYGQS